MNCDEIWNTLHTHPPSQTPQPYFPLHIIKGTVLPELTLNRNSREHKWSAAEVPYSVWHAYSRRCHSSLLTAPKLETVWKFSLKLLIWSCVCLCVIMFAPYFLLQHIPDLLPYVVCACVPCQAMCRCSSSCSGECISKTYMCSGDDLIESQMSW